MQARSRVGRTFLRFAGAFAHAHYRFRKRALLVPSRCDSIAPLGSGKHKDEDKSKITVQIPLTQEEAGIISELQICPVIELLKLIK